MESSLERHVFPKFGHPGNMGVFGPSKSGKTTFLQKLVQHRDEIFRFTKGESEFKSVVYYYGSTWQPVFQTLSDEDPSIQFRMGYPKNAIREEIPEEDRPALVIFDDLEREIQKNPKAIDIVTRDSHHLGLFVVMVFQNLYPSGKHVVAMYRNMDTLVYFRYSNNDYAIISRFRNFYSGGKKASDLMEIYKKWTEERGGYMVIDNHPDLEGKDTFSIRKGVFPQDLEDLKSRTAIMSGTSVKRTRQSQYGSGQVSKFPKSIKNDYNMGMTHSLYKEPVYFAKHGRPTIVKNRYLRNKLLYGDRRPSRYT